MKYKSVPTLSKASGSQEPLSCTVSHVHRLIKKFVKAKFFSAPIREEGLQAQKHLPIISQKYAVPWEK